MNDKEFADIVNSTKHVVLAAVKKHLEGHYSHAIDDIVQETYLRAYRALNKNSFRGDSSIETWIYTIARNESMRMMKKINREEMKLKRKAEKIEESSETTESLDFMGYSINRMDIEHGIDNLPEKYKKVMELLFLGFSEKQIADELSLNKGTVKSRVFRGRSILQRIFSADAKYVS